MTIITRRRPLTALAGGFSRRYGGQVVVLETIAAVPAMVAASLLHLQCLRQLIDDRGWVRAFLSWTSGHRPPDPFGRLVT